MEVVHVGDWEQGRIGSGGIDFGKAVVSFAFFHKQAPEGVENQLREGYRRIDFSHPPLYNEAIRTLGFLEMITAIIIHPRISDSPDRFKHLEDFLDWSLP